MGSVIDDSAWDERTYEIVFTSATQYDIVDDTSTIVANGTYNPGDTIELAGVNVSLNGPAAAGDRFTVRSSERSDVMTIVEQLAVTLETKTHSSSERAAQNNGLNVALSDISRAIDHLVEVQTSIGARLNVVEQEENLNANVNVQLQGTLSSIRDVDIVEAATRFNQTLISLQAAQQAFARVQQLSLFNVL